MNKWDTNNDGCISIDEFKSYLSKDQDILRTLSQAGLITSEDLRTDFGGNHEFPECDSDLEDEINLKVREKDLLRNRIKNNIDHTVVDAEDQELIKIKKKA